MIGDNIYEVTDGEDTLIYAPFKNLIFSKWKAGTRIQSIVIRLIPDKYSVPSNVLKPTVLELDMSHGCSLNCTYCSVNSNDEDRRLRMTFGLARIAIDYVMRYSKEENDPFAVVFIGKGEPTSNWDVLARCVDYIRSQKETLGVKGKTIVVTNGIVSTKRAKWLAQNVDHIALSWDGDPEIQKLQRPLLNGGNSYGIVERTASILRDEEAYFEIRTTWTSLNVGKMLEFTEMFVVYHPFELNYQPLLEVGRAPKSGLSKPPIDIFVDNFLESKRIANEEGIEVMMPSVEINRLNRKFCHAYEGTGFHLTASGNITACECVFSEDDGVAGRCLVYGRIRSGEIEIDEEKISFLRKIRVDDIPSCRECFVRWHCAGGCLNTHLQYSNNPLSERKHLECEITKQIVWRLLKNFALGNGRKEVKNYVAKSFVVGSSGACRKN